MFMQIARAACIFSVDEIVVFDELPVQRCGGCEFTAYDKRQILVPLRRAGPVV